MMSEFSIKVTRQTCHFKCNDITEKFNFIPHILCHLQSIVFVTQYLLILDQRVRISITKISQILHPKICKNIYVKVLEDAMSSQFWGSSRLHSHTRCDSISPLRSWRWSRVPTRSNLRNPLMTLCSKRISVQEIWFCTTTKSLKPIISLRRMTKCTWSFR